MSTCLNEFTLVEPQTRRVKFGFCSVCRAVVELLLNMGKVQSPIPGKSFWLQFWYGTIKRGRQLEVRAKNEISSINNLIKIRAVLGVFRHAESKSSLYLGLSLFLKEVSLILRRNPWQLFQVSETCRVFGQNSAVRLIKHNLIHYGNAMISGHNSKLGNQLYTV